MNIFDKNMDLLIKLEELTLFGGSIYLFTLTPYAWWVFPLLLFVPDISMLGYVINTKLGSIIYNFGHHRGIIILLYFLAVYIKSDVLALISIILFAHSTLDRVFGYGLKYSDDFKHTHLNEL